jgi:hypothetical protein
VRSIRLRALLLGVLLLGLASAQQVRGADGPAASLSDYDTLWLAAMGDLIAAARQPPATPGAPGAPAEVPSFAQASAALNRHVAQLLETLPPTQRLRQQLVLLPLLAEATAALQAVGDAAQAGDQAALAAARDWLVDSCVRLREEAARP